MNKHCSVVFDEIDSLLVCKLNLLNGSFQYFMGKHWNSFFHVKFKIPLAETRSMLMLFAMNTA